MAFVDPTGHQRYMRIRGGIHRRMYSAPYPNFVWHIDKNDKLARYRIYVFGAIDGHSKKVVYLHATNHCRKIVHYENFERAVHLFGQPNLVRVDDGRENYLLRTYQQFLGGHWIVGRSLCLFMFPLYSCFLFILRHCAVFTPLHSSALCRFHTSSFFGTVPFVYLLFIFHSDCWQIHFQPTYRKVVAGNKGTMP